MTKTDASPSPTMYIIHWRKCFWCYHPATAVFFILKILLYLVSHLPSTYWLSPFPHLAQPLAETQSSEPQRSPQAGSSQFLESSTLQAAWQKSPEQSAASNTGYPDP